MRTNRVQRIFIAILSFVFSSSLIQAQATTTKQTSLWENGVFLSMLFIIIILFLMIAGMAEMVKGGARYQVKKSKENNGKKITAILILVGTATLAHAQTISPVVQFDYWGLGAMLFWSLLAVILFELIILYMLFRTGMMLLDVKEKKELRHAEKTSELPSFLEKLNASVAVSDEEAIMFDHEYDGIRELDNNLPPWWKYGFYMTIIFAVIYLVHFHVLHTGPSSLEEYNAQVKAGEEQVAEYRKTAADLVDETNVTRLTDQASIDAGKQIFTENCVACHGSEGQGGMGPNFTDDYWIYKGGIKDIFTSIKYGRSNGMKSWKDELSPMKIQQVASFIKSLRGTHPSNPKEKQGELYIEEGTAPQADSAAKPVADSAKHTPDSSK